MSSPGLCLALPMNDTREVSARALGKYSNKPVHNGISLRVAESSGNSKSEDVTADHSVNGTLLAALFSVSCSAVSHVRSSCIIQVVSPLVTDSPGLYAR